MLIGKLHSRVSVRFLSGISISGESCESSASLPSKDLGGDSSWISLSMRKPARFPSGLISNAVSLPFSFLERPSLNTFEVTLNSVFHRTPADS